MKSKVRIKYAISFPSRQREGLCVDYVTLPFPALDMNILFHVNNMASITLAANESSNPIIFMITQC